MTRSHGKAHVLFLNMIFVFHLRSKHIKINTQLLFLFKWDCYDSLSKTRNGIMQFSSRYRNKLRIIFAPRKIQETRKQFYGIGSFLIDFISRMSPRQVVNLNRNWYVTIFKRKCVIYKRSIGVFTTSTSNKELAFVFRIEIDKIFSFQKSRFQSESSSHSRFLIFCEEAFHWSMLYIRVDGQGQSHSHSYSIISAQSCSFGFHPVAFNIGLNRLGVEIEIQ